MPSYPSGTVTFLFTDIEGSTRRWERDPAAMYTAVERHFAILREAIEAHRGVLFKTIGDAVQAAFPTAAEAVAAVLTAQRAIAAAEWGDVGRLWVRMAIHSGPATPRDGDYLAPCLNRLARLLSAAYGGQILLTQSVADAVRHALPPDASLRDLGEHRLRDLLQDQHVYQLDAPDLERDFPPLKTLDRVRHNLPAQPTALIGREVEIERIRALITGGNTRLVTLTGPGGTGKTRLSLQVAAELSDAFADGVWFVPLAAVTAADRVVPAIAAVFGVREEPGRSFLDGLIAELGPKQTLLVLDNLEQVAAAAPDVARLVESCPRLAVLTTSRVPLRVYGEREVSVEPLTLPVPATSLTPEDALRSEAVRLFVERAQAVRADFTLTPTNAADVVAICRRLDGLPLAIELAAARIKLLPPPALLARLDRRLPLLTGGSVDRPQRQQTLRAAIAWSYDLLSDNERTVFRRLAVFPAGCTLDAAETVIAEGERREAEETPSSAFRLPSPASVFDGIAALVDHSLLRQEETATGGYPEPRLRMLETIREFAWEELERSGEAAVVRDRQAAWCLALTNAAHPALNGPEQATWLGRLDAEQDNLRAALDWTIGQGDAATALPIAAHLWHFWNVRGALTEGRNWLDRALNLQGGTPIDRAAALRGSARLAEGQGDFRQATALNERAIIYSRECGDRLGQAHALANLAGISAYQGQSERAVLLTQEALAIFRDFDDTLGESIMLNDLGALAYLNGDFAEAVARYEEALSIARRLGNSQNIAIALANLADTFLRQGDTDRAKAHFDEALALFRQLGDQAGLGMALVGLGQIALVQGDLNSASRYLREGLDIVRAIGHAPGIAHCLDGLANLACAEERWLTAARAFGAAAGVRDSLGVPLDAAYRADHERNLVAARAMIGPTAFDEAFVTGRRLRLDEIVEEF